jgi:hypothetical protein
MYSLADPMPIDPDAYPLTDPYLNPYLAARFPEMLELWAEYAPHVREHLQRQAESAGLPLDCVPDPWMIRDALELGYYADPEGQIETTPAGRRVSRHQVSNAACEAEVVTADGVPARGDLICVRLPEAELPRAVDDSGPKVSNDFMRPQLKMDDRGWFVRLALHEPGLEATVERDSDDDLWGEQAAGLWVAWCWRFDPSEPVPHARTWGDILEESISINRLAEQIERDGIPPLDQSGLNIVRIDESGDPIEEGQ